MSLLGKLKAAKAEVEAPADPWLAPLHRVRGKLEFDGQERVSSQTRAAATRSRCVGMFAGLRMLERCVKSRQRASAWTRQSRSL